MRGRFGTAVQIPPPAAVACEAGTIAKAVAAAEPYSPETAAGSSREGLSHLVRLRRFSGLEELSLPLAWGLLARRLPGIAQGLPTSIWGYTL